MPLLSRITLLLSALMCGGFVATTGAGFSLAVEPDRFSTASALLWIALGAITAAPMWAPALTPGRWHETLKLVRRCGALFLLGPTSLFSSIVTHNIGRLVSGMGAAPDALAAGLVLTGCCIVSLVVLVLPDTDRIRARVLTEWKKSGEALRRHTDGA